MHRPLRPLLLLAALALVAAGCADDDATSPTTSATSPVTTLATTTSLVTTLPPTTAAAITTTVPSGPRAYTEPGPYPVGYIEVELRPGEPMAVWYPGEPGSEEGQDKASYDLVSYLPAAEQPKVPSGPETSYTMDAYAGLPVAAEGRPFPLVLFSHGAAGYRHQSTFLTTHLASWGVVVAAPEHPSRDLTAVLEGRAGQGPSDVDDLRLAVQRMEAESLSDEGPLATAVDTGKVAVVGHSAGGGAAYRMASDPHVVTYVALASPVGLAPPPSDPNATTTTIPHPAKPSLLIAGTGDAIASIDRVRQAYAGLPAPKRFAELGDVTHLGFMDVCYIAPDQGGVLQYAKDQGVAVPDVIVRLFADGCDAQYTPAEESWPAQRHLTTAQVRWALGLDPEPVGLDDAVVDAYAPLVTDFQQG